MGETATNFFDLTATALDGKPVAMRAYAGKVVLVVNVASKCGFTPQYTGLEQIYKDLSARGLVVLGFPCNQFGAQEPGTAEEIKQFCSLTYPVTFPLFEKVDVNGANAHPVYQFLKSEKPGFLGTEAIKWNFTKFLIDRSGQVVARFSPQDKPEAIVPEIEKYLAAK